MTGDIFKQAIEKASELPADQQDAIGSLILFELEDEAKWAKSFENSQEELGRMAEQALKEFAEGKTDDMFSGKRDAKDLAS
jgi:hypothetical protein